MTKKSGGLGRGLGSLFGDAGVDLSVLNHSAVEIRDEEGAQSGEEAAGRKKAAIKTGSGKSGAPAKKAPEDKSGESVVFIRLDDIKPNAAQPRKVFESGALEELASSIKEHGVIQPVLVRPMGKAYELVAGERRWRAARLAGLRQIPAIVRSLSDRQNMFYALIENMQREDLNSIEEARGMEEMMRAFGLSQEETAHAVGKSRPYVSNALRLLKLPMRIQDMVMQGNLSAGHARAIAGLPGEALQLEAADKAVRMGWSVRRIESYAVESKKAAKPRKTRAKSSDMAAVEQQIREKLGTKVRINGNEKRGRIELEYYSRGELERLIDILNDAEK